MHRLFPLTLVILIVATRANAEPPKSIMLKPKWTKGDKVFVERTSIAEQRYTTGPMAGSGGNSKSVTIAAEEVTEASADKGATLKFTFERMIFNVRNPQVNTSFDTQKDDAEEEETGIGAMLMAAKGGSFSIEVDKDLRSKSVTGMKELVAKMEKASDSTMMTQQLLRNEFGDAIARTVWIDSRTALYANKEVKPGDKWTSEFATETADRGTQTYALNCTLAKFEKRDGRDMALITYAGTSKQVGESKPTNGQKVTMKDGTIDGSAVFDIALGRIVELRAEASMKIDIDIEAGGQKMTIGVDVDRTITTRVTDTLPTPRTLTAKKNDKNGDAPDGAAEKKDAKEQKSGKKPRAGEEAGDDDAAKASEETPAKPKKADRDDVDDDGGR